MDTTARTTDFERVDMSDAALVRDPYAGYSRIRERSPLALGVRRPAPPLWLVTRYDDVRAAYTDPRFAANPLNVPGRPGRHLSETVLREGETPPAYLRYRTGRLAQHDGAAHARLRGLAGRAFSERAAAARAPRIAEVAEDLLAGLPERADTDGTVDLFRHYCLPLANTVLCELIGVPAGDHPRWLGLTAGVKSVPLVDRPWRWEALTGFAARLIQRRRAAPADDLISDLIRGDAGGGLTDAEITALMLLDHDAHRSVAQLVANGIAAVLRRPRQAAPLRRGAVPPGAVHELLRFCAPVTVGSMRHVAEDVELRGVRLRPGEAVWPVLAAADWDPRAFRDPERLDLTREASGHLAFGAGPHRCPGGALTVVTAEIALGALFRAYPAVALGAAPHGDPKPRQWGVAELTVRIRPTSEGDHR